MVIRFNRDKLKYILMMLPFFEPYSISMMSESSFIWMVIGLLFTAGRYLVSLYVIVEYLINKKKHFSMVGYMCIVFVLARIFASTINGSLYIMFLLSMFTYIGIILICEKLIWGEEPELFFDVLIELFGFFSIIGVLSIIAFPNGFNHADTKAEALYFLGSKNSSFYYFFAFLTAWILKSAYNKRIKNEKQTLYTIGFFLIIIGASFICDSSNSVASIGLLFCFYLLVRCSDTLFKLTSPQALFVVIIVVTLLLLLKGNIPLFNNAFSLLGRSSTISGRDYIWSEQLPLISKNPIWGNGIIVETVLKSGSIATHAHNFYLDTLVKFGVVSLLSLLVLILAAIRNVSKMKNFRFKVLFAGVLFCMLLHNVFDDISLYLLFMILMLTEYSAVLSINKLRSIV